MLSDPLAAFLARRGIHYGWVMVAITFLTMLATAAAMGMPGVLMLPLEKEFGWDTGSISGALALRLALFGMVGPFAAALMQRYGLRRTISAALAMIVVGLVLASQMHALWELWASWGVLVGLATGMTALVFGATVANRWFATHRGLVMGLLTASNATGQLLFLPVAAWLADHYGWRMALAPAVIACLFCLVLMLLFARDHPGELGLPAFGESRVVAPPTRGAAGSAVRLSLAALRDGARSWVFWILFFTFFVCGLSTNGLVQNHFIPLCHDFGMTDVAAASVLAMMGAFDFAGTILSGWLSDRFDNRWLLFWYYGLRGLSLLALPYSTFTFYGLSVFAMFYGLDWVATVPPTVKLAGSAFGRERAPLVFGWVFMAHQLGAASAALGGGLSRDAFASYLPAFAVAGVACLFAAMSVLTVRHQQAARLRPAT
ncbi:MAG: MFS transporter [Rhodospirillales bacterium]|nr:MFS transporter [Rhodospirillales bacterium]MDE2199092.1 MFS transporter [Rhodospirillales bacterium]